MEYTSFIFWFFYSTEKELAKKLGNCAAIHNQIMKNVSKKKLSMKYAILLDFMAYTNNRLICFHLFFISPKSI